MSEGMDDRRGDEVTRWRGRGGMWGLIPLSYGFRYEASLTEKTPMIWYLKQGRSTPSFFTVDVAPAFSVPPCPSATLRCWEDCTHFLTCPMLPRGSGFCWPLRFPKPNVSVQTFKFIAPPWRSKISMASPKERLQYSCCLVPMRVTITDMESSEEWKLLFLRVWKRPRSQKSQTEGPRCRSDGIVSLLYCDSGHPKRPTLSPAQSLECCTCPQLAREGFPFLFLMDSWVKPCNGGQGKGSYYPFLLSLGLQIPTSWGCALPDRCWMNPLTHHCG